MVPRTNEETSILENTEKFSKRGKICGISTKTGSSFLHSCPATSKAKTLLQTASVKNTGPPLPPASTCFFLKQQDFRLSHPAPRYLLLRLNPGQVQSRGECSLLLPSTQFMEQFMVPLRMLGSWALLPWLVKQWLHHQEK